MTNENKIMELLLGNSAIDNAIFMERIQRISELTRQEIEKNPQGFSTPFTTPEMYLALCNQIDAAAKMEEPINSVTHYLLFDDFAADIRRKIDNEDDIFDMLQLFEDENANYEIYTHEAHEKSQQLAERVELYRNYIIIDTETLKKLEEMGLC
jgi:hypothetical protein